MLRGSIRWLRKRAGVFCGKLRLRKAHGSLVKCGVAGNEGRCGSVSREA